MIWICSLNHFAFNTNSPFAPAACLIIMNKFFAWILSLACLTGLGQQASHFVYRGEKNTRVAYPVGAIGAGMFCVEGTGSISAMSVRHYPDIFNEPVMFAALYVKGRGAKVLEGPVPAWKKFGQPGTAMGAENASYGLARCSGAAFSAQFPFGKVALHDDALPVKVNLTAWNPFIPTDADNSSLPVAGLEYQFTNTSPTAISAVFSYNARNFMATDDTASSIKPVAGGFLLSQIGTAKAPESQGDFAIWTDEQTVTMDYCWFRGDWWDPLTMAWRKIGKGDVTPVAAVEKDAPGASVYVPFILKPGQSKTIRIFFSWYVPYSHLRYGVRSNRSSDTTISDRTAEQPSTYYMPWYASRFKKIDDVIFYWQNNYGELKRKTRLFTDAFYKSTLPPEVIDAVGSNLSILKSPTVMRQYDGRFWGWEGCNDRVGSCAGNCTHVYTYAQALCHLFPAMERTIRETELSEGMDSFGHQNYRMAMPIRAEGHQLFLPAADGQLGSIIRMYRDWRISGDNELLKRLYPKLKVCIDYAVRTWDPEHTGTLVEPHHNTYDIEFWGPDGMCTGIYLSALEAMIGMGRYLHEDISEYQALYTKGKKQMEENLFNGEYFIQDIRWTGLKNDPKIYRNTATRYEAPSPETLQMLDREGPKYQYGKGCLSDGVFGCWMARVAGLPEPVDEKKIKSHLSSVYRYNFKKDLSGYSNPQRSTFALGKEGGLLLCSWPKGEEPPLPFVYSNEVWTGVEYEVASHLIFEGKLEQGLNIVRATRKRYDGSTRNPFDEYECGHWYMRAMSSYALLEACTGVRYDAVDRTLYVRSQVGDFVSFLSTDTGFGNVIYKNGKATVKVVYGKIDIRQIKIKK